MSNVRPLPVSGYRIEKVYSSVQKLCTKKDDAATEPAINVNWDWMAIDPEIFEVALHVSVEPYKGREEYVEANVIGRFRQAIPEPTVTRDDFVRLQAPAILLPYVRETICSLTNHGFYGSYHLPSLNVVRLMQDFQPELATGASQGIAASGPPKKAIAAGEAEPQKVAEPAKTVSGKAKKVSPKKAAATTTGKG